MPDAQENGVQTPVASTSTSRLPSPSPTTSSSNKPQPKKRGALACRRCRLLRAKCKNDGSLIVPCEACQISRVSCEFPTVRGTSLVDRAPRGIRKRRKKAESVTEGAGVDTAASAGVSWPGGGGGEELPPIEEVVEACEALFSGYYQLSFLHRPSFIAKLNSSSPTSTPIPRFLLLAVLAIGARFSPALIKRYGSRTGAVEVFLSSADKMMPSEMYFPTLERVQAFYLLGVADWGKGHGFRSRILHGIALQMADSMSLAHPSSSLSALETEIQRRTWWFINMNNNLLALGTKLPGAPDPDDNSTPVPLPANEDDFNFGILTKEGERDLEVTEGKGEGSVSLLGAMLQIIAIWGRTARALCNISSGGGGAGSGGLSATSAGEEFSKFSPPWSHDSLFEFTRRDLIAWLGRLDNRQKWSTNNLRAWKTTNHDLGFFSLFATFHLVNLALRRQYLPIMIQSLHPSAAGKVEEIMCEGEVPPNGVEYWRVMAERMVQHAFDLIELHDLVTQVRLLNNGGTPFFAFALYLSGSMMNYLRSCPYLCPSKAPQAASALTRVLSTLHSLVDVWPVSERWFRTLSAQAGAGLADASNDLNLDKKVGIYRQFDDYGSSSSPSASVQSQTTPSEVIVVPSLPTAQFDAASTLAQLSSGSPAAPLPSQDEYQHFLSTAGTTSGSTMLAAEAPMEEGLPLFDFFGGPDGFTFDLSQFENDISSYLMGDLEVFDSAGGGGSFL